MDVIGLPAFNDNYIWIITNPKNKSFCCVDPGIADPVLLYQEQTGFKLSDILITHHHQDHTGGIEALLCHNPCINVYAPDDSRISAVTSIVGNNDTVYIGDLKFRIITTPGHTSSHICYFEPQKEWLFCGDTLFSAGCGRVFDGTIEDLHQSLLTLKSLPNTTKIYCGHEYTLQNLRFAAFVEADNKTIQAYSLELQERIAACSLPSTIALEKEINPFLRTDAPSVIKFAQEHGVSSKNSRDIFKLLREQKNNFVC